MVGDNVQRQKNVHGYVSAHPLPSDEDLRLHYESKYYQHTTSATYQSNYLEPELKHIRLRADILVSVAARVLRDIGGMKTGSPTFLDVGCGEGFNLAAAAKMGMSVEGFDFSRFAIEKFHPQLMPHFRSGNAYQLLDELIEGRRRYDILLLKNVLEHVVNPERLMQRLVEMMDRSVLAVQVPNDESALQHWLMDHNKVDRPYWFTPPEHLHYFNYESFTQFVAKFGLRVADIIADFPIEWFLMHDGSNYSRNSSAGAQAHQARIHLELLMAEAGLDRLEAFSRALAGCRQGRSFIAYLVKAG